MTFTALVATFDTKTAKTIEKASQLFPTNQANPFPQPHCTLAIYDTVSCDELTHLLTNITLPSPFSVHFPAMGFLGKAVEAKTFFVALSPHDTLIALQKKLTTPFAEQTSRLYQPDLWYPHATLALNLPHNTTIPTEKLAEILQLPMKGNIISISVTEVSRDRTHLLQRKDFQLT